MAQILAFTALGAQIDRNSAGTAADAADLTAAPEMVSSHSLIVVMVVYVLFGAAGFFAAAQML
jgi:hypothetical protein